MRCVQNGGSFILQEKGEHGTELSTSKRKNSVLSWEEEEKMRLAARSVASANESATV
jgi:hypothetical protein